VSTDVQHAVEQAARHSYGRLVALLASRTRDVAAAEDALNDAFLRALTRWPLDGVPANPDGWLIAAAQRRLIDSARHDSVRARAEPELAYAATLVDAPDHHQLLPDRRLQLLFACAHPAIDPNIRTPLMLQTVLGLEAEVIASAFLAAPSAMAQRLVRAKRKIRDAGIPFEIPDHVELPERRDAVLEAIYAAFGAGWDALDGSDPTRADLTGEAIFLGRLVVAALPDDAECLGLLALMLYCQSRAAARRSATGAYVPLSAQRHAQWDQRIIGEAETHLAAAARLKRPGRFQFEAAIQSAHVGHAFDRAADPRMIVALYDALLSVAPTIGAMVNRAAAIATAEGPGPGLAATDAIPSELVVTYQPWWALRAHLLEQLGRTADARDARHRAAGMTQDAAVRAFLLRDPA
jgi:RNA polymerase sigma-70 factor (ECF subfamily)